MARTLVAAAVPAGAVVRRGDGSEVTISRVENGVPRLGSIAWTDKASGATFHVSAARKVEIVSLPT